MRLLFYGQSDKGRVRKANEDYFANEKLNKNEHLFIVADGMGGHQAGDVASKLGTLTFIKEYRVLRGKQNPIVDSMQQSLRKANLTILEKASADPSKKGMGTTFSAMVITGKKAHIIHVGDSRIYLIRDKEIQRITTDHTFVEKMMEEGRISEEEARNHPQKNILYMSLGARESFSPIVIEDFEVKDGDIYVMCSDGLNNMVSDELIKDHSLSCLPKELVEKLIKLANEKGGTDNITIQAIKVGGNMDRKKTEPIKIQKRKSIMLILSFIAILVILLVLFFWFYK